MRVLVALLLGFIAVALTACAGTGIASTPTPDFAATVTPIPPIASPTAVPPPSPTSTASPMSAATLAIETPSPTAQPLAIGSGAILFTRAGNRLFAHDLQTGKEWQIAEGMRDLDWTKDGMRAVMVDAKQSGQGGAIWTVNRDGSGLEQLTAGPADGHPRWSPDGQQIVFERNAHYDPSRQTTAMAEVWLMDANGANARKLADGFNPAWSPEGKRIAYATNPELANDEQGFSRNGIGLMNAAGANRWVPVSTQMPSDKYTTMQWTLAQARLLDQPQWSPDGTEITFRALGGNSAYLTTDATQGGVKQFVALFFDATPWGFSYSPNGAYITLGSGGQSGVQMLGVYRRGIAGHDGYTAAQALATLGHIPKNTGEVAMSLDGFAWAPDRSALIYAVSTENGGGFAPKGIYILTIATGVNTQVVADGSAPVFWLP